MSNCENCEDGLVTDWQPTRHGWITTAKACHVCNGSGKVDEPEREGDERDQPCRDSGLPTFEQIEEWERLR